MMNAIVNPVLTEALLQYIWQAGLFHQDNLTTITGEPVRIIRTGTLNRDSGPDFSGALIKVGNIMWGGNIELHLQASGWYKHRHQHDLNYRNVVLHVVFELDAPPDKLPPIPCIELQNRIPKILLERYQKLMREQRFVPCEHQAAQVSSLVWSNWKERMLAERWESRAAVFGGWLEQTRGNWEEVCFRAVAQALGMPVNATPFLQLASITPHLMLVRHKPHLFQLEALLFGQAGLLEGDMPDAYSRKLAQEYAHLRRKYRLQSMPGHLWKFLRMRPSSFPTLRIATLAALIHQTSHLFSRLLETDHPEELFHVELSPYWQQHYRFGKTMDKPAGIGTVAIRNLLVNTVCPLLYLYAKHNKVPHLHLKALRLIEGLEPEDNAITRNWETIGIKSENAVDSQALLQLKQHYCEQKRCLECAVGTKLLRG
ncbi:DUF2851 family protein [Chitinophaga horti]|uniref:DUF2851 family protein n=1 Tax=Chitinophaga horti TaxID=2920382 RepID=A0ABY6IZP5_9BACT|nr:DUF2851 family protein [Chitinophaga horti]UYQ91544.1 DUF2851 family protein [Chitinophaga horti]